MAVVGRSWLAAQPTLPTVAALVEALNIPEEEAAPSDAALRTWLSEQQTRDWLAGDVTAVTALLDGWSAYLGKWADELAFSVLDKQDADHLLAGMELLSIIEPRPRRYLGCAAGVACNVTSTCLAHQVDLKDIWGCFVNECLNVWQLSMS